MKKIVVTFLLILTSLNALADCQSAYIKAAKKRQLRNNRIMYGVAIGSVFIAPVVAGGALLGVVAYDNSGMDSAVKNTYGKVRSALAGETSITLKKVAGYLKKHGVKIDRNDPLFEREVSDIIYELDVTGRACPTQGYDEEFNDKYKLLNFTKFTKLIAAEYLLRNAEI